jgi:hypothetical protein
MLCAQNPAFENIGPVLILGTKPVGNNPPWLSAKADTPNAHTYELVIAEYSTITMQTLSQFLSITGIGFIWFTRWDEMEACVGQLNEIFPFVRHPVNALPIVTVSFDMGEIARLHRDNVTISHDYAMLSQEFQQLQSDYAHLQAQYDPLSHKISHMTQQLDDALQRLAIIESSRSWRWIQRYWRFMDRNWVGRTIQARRTRKGSNTP